MCRAFLNGCVGIHIRTTSGYLKVFTLSASGRDAGLAGQGFWLDHVGTEFLLRGIRSQSVASAAPKPSEGAPMECGSSLYGPRTHSSADAPGPPTASSTSNTCGSTKTMPARSSRVGTAIRPCRTDRVRLVTAPGEMELDRRLPPSSPAARRHRPACSTPARRPPRRDPPDAERHRLLCANSRVEAPEAGVPGARLRWRPFPAFRAHPVQTWQNPTAQGASGTAVQLPWASRPPTSRSPSRPAAPATSSRWPKPRRQDHHAGPAHRRIDHPRRVAREHRRADLLAEAARVLQARLVEIGVDAKVARRVRCVTFDAFAQQVLNAFPGRRAAVPGRQRALAPHVRPASPGFSSKTPSAARRGSSGCPSTTT